MFHPKSDLLRTLEPVSQITSIAALTHVGQLIQRECPDARQLESQTYQGEPCVQLDFRVSPADPNMQLYQIFTLHSGHVYHANLQWLCAQSTQPSEVEALSLKALAHVAQVLGLPDAGAGRRTVKAWRGRDTTKSELVTEVWDWLVPIDGVLTSRNVMVRIFASPVGRKGLILRTAASWQIYVSCSFYDLDYVG